MIATSPVLKKSEVKGNKIILTFDDVGTGLKLKSGDKLNEFAIAGDDKKFVWAEAKIVGKNKVEVWSEKIPNPQAVRYAFNNNPPNPNLTNDSGLPAIANSFNLSPDFSFNPVPTSSKVKIILLPLKVC